MNDYVIYETAKLRYAELVDEVRRSRTTRARNSSTGVRTNARQRFAAVARALTNRTPAPKAA